MSLFDVLRVLGFHFSSVAFFPPPLMIVMMNPILAKTIMVMTGELMVIRRMLILAPVVAMLEAVALATLEAIVVITVPLPFIVIVNALAQRGRHLPGIIPLKALIVMMMVSGGGKLAGRARTNLVPPATSVANWPVVVEPSPFGPLTIHLVYIHTFNVLNMPVIQSTVMWIGVLNNVTRFSFTRPPTHLVPAA